MLTASCTVLSGRTKCKKLQKVEKQLKHELFRYKVRNLLTATCTVQYMKNSHGLFFINNVIEESGNKGLQ
jgi:hypothetical protein